MTQIIEIYAARFTIELAIRDLRAYFGLADYQCTTAMAIHRFVHLACVAFSLLRLMQLGAESGDWLPEAKGMAPLSFARLRRGLQRFLIGRILSPNCGEMPKSSAIQSEFDVVMRIVA